MDERRRAEHGVGGAPGLDPPSRHRKARGQLLERLIGVGKGQMPPHPAADLFLKILLHLRLDDADGLAEAGALCIIQGKIHEKVSFWIHRGCLLEAAKAAAHSGCHDDQSRFYHGVSLLFSGIARGSCYLHSSPTADRMQGQNKELEKILSLCPPASCFLLPRNLL